MPAWPARRAWRCWRCSSAASARPYPLIDFTLFRNPVFSSAVATALFAAAALMGMELVFSQRLQLVQGLSPMQAALYILPLSLAAFVAGPLAGWMLPRVGGSRMLAWSLLVSGTGMGGYLLSYDATLAPQMASLCVLGAGIGAAMTAASGTIMQNAPAGAGMAASIEEVSYDLGSALGVTLMGSILSGVYAQSLAMPAGVAALAARDSLDEALIVAEGLPVELGSALAQLARAAFDAGYATVLASCTAMLLGAAALVISLNRRRSQRAQAVTGRPACAGRLALACARRASHPPERPQVQHRRTRRVDIHDAPAPVGEGCAEMVLGLHAQQAGVRQVDAMQVEKAGSLHGATCVVTMSCAAPTASTTVGPQCTASPVSIGPLLTKTPSV